MKGDYGKRPADAAKQYHGFGFWQIDIASFPSFISSGKWVDPAQRLNRLLRPLIIVAKAM